MYYALFFLGTSNMYLLEAMESFAFHDKIIPKALKFCKSAASCTFLTKITWTQLNVWDIFSKEPVVEMPADIVFIVIKMLILY